MRNQRDLEDDYSRMHLSELEDRLAWIDERRFPKAGIEIRDWIIRRGGTPPPLPEQRATAPAPAPSVLPTPASCQVALVFAVMIAALWLNMSAGLDQISRNAGTALLLLLMALIPYLLAIGATFALNKLFGNRWHASWGIYVTIYSVIYYFLHPNSGYLASTYLGVEVLGITFVVVAGTFINLVLTLVWSLQLIGTQSG